MRSLDMSMETDRHRLVCLSLCLMSDPGTICIHVHVLPCCFSYNQSGIIFPSLQLFVFIYS